MTFLRVLGAEFRKLKRSKVTWLSFLFYGFFGLIAWFIFWMLRNPEAARNLGLLGQKASFIMNGISADWPGLFMLFAELGIAGGMIILSLIVIYLFGREYADGTAKNMLALPLPRGYFVAAKLCVTAIWYALLSSILLLECFLIGRFLGLGAVPPGLFAREAGNILIASTLVLALMPLVAWVTVASGNYLAPFGYTIATLLVGNLMIRTGWARWFPWSIVALLSGMAGPREPEVVLESGIIMIATFAVGVAATILHQVRADNCQ